MAMPLPCVRVCRLTHAKDSGLFGVSGDATNDAAPAARLEEIPSDCMTRMFRDASECSRTSRRRRRKGGGEGGRGRQEEG